MTNYKEFLSNNSITPNQSSSPRDYKVLFSFPFWKKSLRRQGKATAERSTIRSPSIWAQFVKIKLMCLLLDLGHCMCLGLKSLVMIRVMPLLSTVNLLIQHLHRVPFLLFCTRLLQQPEIFVHQPTCVILMQNAKNALFMVGTVQLISLLYTLH